MKSLHTYISEKLIIRANKTKQKITPRNRQELNAAILNNFEYGDGDLNNIDVSKLKKEDFYALFNNLIYEINKNNITEINVSNWKLEKLYCDPKRRIGMFDNCKTLETIILPDCLKEIDNWAFYFCTKLNNITISNLVSKIGDSAFRRCNDLTSIIIPDSVTKSACMRLKIVLS